MGGRGTRNWIRARESTGKKGGDVQGTVARDRLVSHHFGTRW